MFRTPTTFVIGAGASFEVGMPTGLQLKKKLIELLTPVEDDYPNEFGFDSSFRAAMTNHQDKNWGSDIYLDSYRKKCIGIAKALPLTTSIDSYLETHQDDNVMVYCGKIGIARAILESEAQSTLLISSDNILNTMDFSRIENTWFVKFARCLFDGYKKADMSRVFENVSIITFNYARCIEHFLHSSLIENYKISSVEAADIMKTLKIFHPYGSLGDLPWQKTSAIPFGDLSQLNKINEIAVRIKTYTERISEETMAYNIKNRVSNAEQLVFLGFAFHDQNMRILQPERRNSISRVLATSYGESKHNIAVVEDYMKRNFIKNTDSILIDNDMTCTKFFEQFNKILTSQ